MSYIVLSDRVKETSLTQGTGNFSLEGAVRGFSSFGSSYSDGDSLFYAITDGTNYEVGSGIYITGVENQITRSPLSSSNSNNIVDFGIGLKEVFVTYPGTHSVYHASGYGSEEAPVGSGIAFWLSSNIIGYDSSFLWDNSNNRLGINKLAPDYAIELGGYGPDAIIRASGFMVGDSGVFFPEANNGDSEYEGGRQIVHFEPNDVLDTDSKTVIDVSGQVNQYIYLKEQPKGFVLAGPPSGCTDGCSEAVPQFRPLTIKDIPNLDSIYATDGQLEGVSGMLEAASGYLFQDIQGVSGMLEAASGYLFSDIEGVSGMLEAASGYLFQDIQGVSGMLEAASGYLFQDIQGVSGMLEAASGYFFDDIQGVSGMLEAASGYLFSDIEGVSGMLEAASGYLFSDIEGVSGMLEAASGYLFQDIEGVSGMLEVASGHLHYDIDFVSGLLYEASGLLRNDIMNIDTGGDNSVAYFVSGLVYETSGLFREDLGYVSGMVISSGEMLNDKIIAVSGGTLFKNFLVDFDPSAQENQGFLSEASVRMINNSQTSYPTHLRIINNGPASRLLLANQFKGDSDGYELAVSGSTWGCVSLWDGSFRNFNYLSHYEIAVTGTGITTYEGNQVHIIYLDEEKLNLDLPPSLIRLVRGTGETGVASQPTIRLKQSAYVVSDTYPVAQTNNALTLNNLLITDDPENPFSLPFNITILNFGRDALTINSSHNVGINLAPTAITSRLDIQGDSIRLRSPSTIQYSDSSGYTGEMRWDSDYLYICVGPNEWKRCELNTFAVEPTTSTTTTLPP